MRGEDGARERQAMGADKGVRTGHSFHDGAHQTEKGHQQSCKPVKSADAFGPASSAFLSVPLRTIRYLL